MSSAISRLDFGADGKPLPGVAQVRPDRGHAARNGEGSSSNRTRPFSTEPGQHGDHCRASAVADLGWMRLHGYPGWLAWLFVHILNLIGFRNRLVVLVQWAWSYFSYQRAIRLITGSLPELDADASTAERPRPERDPANIAERPRPERGATPPSESERGWGPASTEK